MSLSVLYRRRERESEGVGEGDPFLPDIRVLAFNLWRACYSRLFRHSSLNDIIWRNYTFEG